MMPPELSMGWHQIEPFFDKPKCKHNEAGIHNMQGIPNYRKSAEMYANAAAATIAIFTKDG